jgi:phosphomannomutase
MSPAKNPFNPFGIIGRVPRDVNEDLAWRVGHAVAQFLRTRLSGYERGQASTNRIVLGWDPRPHSVPLAEAVIEGISASGAGCIELGLCDLPRLEFAVDRFASAGGIYISGSDRPAEFNGFRLVGLKAKAVGRESGLAEVERIVGSIQRMPKTASMAAKQNVDVREDYLAHVRKPLAVHRPMSIVVDASNGSAGDIVADALAHENLTIELINDTFEGQFAHRPDPTHPEGYATVAQRVTELSADLGVVLDSAGDRCQFVDERGQPVRADLVGALLVKTLLAKAPGAMVVHDLRASAVLAEDVRQAGGVPRRERPGWPYLNKTMAEGHALFGVELDGRFYFREQMHNPSPLMAAGALLGVLSDNDASLSERIAPLNRYSYSGQVDFPGDGASSKLDALAERFADEKVSRLDGVTVTSANDWFHARATEDGQTVELTVEAPTPADVDGRIEQLKPTLGEPLREI